MTVPKRKRNIQLNFRVTAEELKQIEEKMGQLGVFNREAYLRKMALDGYCVRLDFKGGQRMELSAAHLQQQPKPIRKTRQ